MTAEVGTDDPCIRRCTKRSHLEKKYGVHPRMIFKNRSTNNALCTRSSGCWKAKNHRGKCAGSVCAPVLRIIDDKKEEDGEDNEIITSFFK